MIFFNEVIVELSYNCNLSCIMCGFGKSTNPHDKRKFLSFENYKIILQQVGSITRTIRLNGRGESTIHPDFVKILEYTKESFPGIEVNLFSNFSFYNKRIMESLIKNQVQLFVSIDSPDNEELCAIRKGVRFDFVKQNLECLKDSPKRPFIIFTIQETNIHRIYDIANFAMGQNCSIIYNTVRMDIGIERFINVVNRSYLSIIEQFDKASLLYNGADLHCLFPDQIAGIRLNSSKPALTHGSLDFCPALNSELCILYDGTTTPCNMFNPYYYGNLNTQTLKEIWNGQHRIDFLESHKNHYYCKNCANLAM
jgi:MoaA/NifB/PqqE/SkfB family radical SAM enzyme